MRFEDMPSLPMYVNGRAELLERIRAAITQAELLPIDTNDQCSVSWSHSIALVNFFTALVAKAQTVAASQYPQTPAP